MSDLKKYWIINNPDEWEAYKSLLDCDEHKVFYSDIIKGEQYPFVVVTVKGGNGAHHIQFHIQDAQNLLSALDEPSEMSKKFNTMIQHIRKSAEKTI
jgi:hypothetical protein